MKRNLLLLGAAIGLTVPMEPQSTFSGCAAPKPSRTPEEQTVYESEMAALKITRPDLNSKGRKKVARAIVRSKR
jgi:hypothetical protein